MLWQTLIYNIFVGSTMHYILMCINLYKQTKLISVCDNWDSYEFKCWQLHWGCLSKKYISTTVLRMRAFKKVFILRINFVSDIFTMHPLQCYIVFWYYYWLYWLFDLDIWVEKICYSFNFRNMDRKIVLYSSFLGLRIKMIFFTCLMGAQFHNNPLPNMGYIL